MRATFPHLLLLRLLYPLSLLYGFMTWLRNVLFDLGIFKQTRFSIPVIGIGNLSMGGTGKTPHIEYFIHSYQGTHSIAVVSRGYGRKTKGFRYVSTQDTAETAGDEPLQIKNKFEHLVVAVAEKRTRAIEHVMSDHPSVNLILLDDSFQHRYVKPSLNILLTEYSRPFWKDFVVPAGRLREFRCGWRRADIILLTKCPENGPLSIPPFLSKKPVYLSRIAYRPPVLVSGVIHQKILLVTGIANPSPLLEYLKSRDYQITAHFNFRDHHLFTREDLKEIEQRYRQEMDCMILTTEKDYMRLKPFWKEGSANLAFLPIGVVIENKPKDWLNLSD